MSALPTLHASLPTLDWRRLVPIAEAARKLDMDQGHLARECRKKLETKGLAFYGRQPSSPGMPTLGMVGQAQWWVSIDYDERLLPSVIGDQYQEPDLSVYTQKQRTEALNRRACVEIWNTARTNWTGSTAQILARVLVSLREKFPNMKISRSRLYDWTQRYRRPADTVKLIDTRGGNHRGKASAFAWQAFEDLFLHQNRPSIRACWAEVDRLSKVKGWTWCGLSACSAAMDSRIDPEKQSFHRTPEIWRTQLAPFIPQDTEAWRAGEVWISDHKQLDVICLFGGQKIRPWLTCWMDWRTRRVCGWVLSDNPNSSTILAALRHGMMAPDNFGGPRRVWIDNGKDFSAWVFHGQTKKQRREKLEVKVDEAASFGIFRALNIDAHFSTAYNANGKARLERWFRTLTPFCQTFQTYTGDSIETKPDRLNEILESPRKIPPFAEVQARIADHIAGNNACADHDIDDLVENGERLSSNEAFARWVDTRRILADPASLDLLLCQWHKPVSVTRRGVTINVTGRPLSYGQFEPALSPFKAVKRGDRKPVLVSYDPNDIREIRIYDAGFRFVCTASMNQVGGAHGTGDAISTAHVTELIKQKARYKKALAHVAESGITSVLTSEEHLAQIAAERRPLSPGMPSEGMAMTMVQTPLDGQSKEVQREKMTGTYDVRSQKPEVGSQIENPLDALRGRQRAAVPAEVIEDPFAKLRERNAW